MTGREHNIPQGISYLFIVQTEDSASGDSNKKMPINKGNNTDNRHVFEALSFLVYSVTIEIFRMQKTSFHQTVKKNNIYRTIANLFILPFENNLEHCVFLPQPIDFRGCVNDDVSAQSSQFLYRTLKIFKEFSLFQGENSGHKS